MSRWKLATLLSIMLILSSNVPQRPQVAAASQPDATDQQASQQQDVRFFSETSFRIDNDKFFDYFSKRGAVSAFGFPVSREFRLLGTQVQFFQRRVMQIQPDGSVGLLNVLDPTILSFDSVNFAVFPSFDAALVASAPPPGSLALLDFVRGQAPETFEGLPVRFFSAFLGTVSCAAAFPGQECRADLLPGLALEMWGVPTSAPAFDPNNRDFVFQRFQRGILMFDNNRGAVTERVLVGDALKAVISGQNLPADLAEQAAGSRFFNQWNNALPLGLNRPAELPGTDMSNAFVIQSPIVAAVEVAVTTFAEGLDTPWALAFVPDGRLFVTERPGRLRVIENGRLIQEPVVQLPVAETGESGLMGLAVDPAFPRDPFLYVMYTFNSGQGLRNRISRLVLQGNKAAEDLVLADNLPAASIHDGGRLLFGPDGLLYATLGDVATSNFAQDLGSPAGKILRFNRDGTIPAANPFASSPIYSLGHRNSQGLAWQPGTLRLYQTEHGPVGNDEVNLIEAGKNYGWPTAQGLNHPAPFVSPLAVYSPSIAPAGATFYSGVSIPQWRGSFFFTALTGAHLHRVTFDPGDPRRIVAEERLFQGQFGRLRDVAQGPDGALYVATSNRDGRGNPAPNDDRILRLGPR